MTVNRRRIHLGVKSLPDSAAIILVPMAVFRQISPNFIAFGRQESCMHRVIIIAEDFLTRKNLIRDIPWLEQDCEVVGEAACIVEGTALVLQTQPDILVTDTHLPDGDGLAFWESVRKRVSCACIFISDYAQFELVQRALHLGSKGYLLKPVESLPFFKVLAETVQSVQQQRYYEKIKEQMICDSAPIPAFVQRYFEKDPSSYSERYLADAVRYIRGHYEKALTGKTVAADLGISESYLGKLFREHMGYTFLEYLTMHRVYVALDLLSQTDLKTYQIAEMVGYRDTRHFSDIFKKLVGVTPTQYRNR